MLYKTCDLPSAFEKIKEIKEKKNLVFFFDYDGTLTPIVSEPEDAKLANEMRAIVSKLAKKYPVAIISGRDLQDLKKLVGIDGLYFAGSHGFDIEGPNNVRHALSDAIPLIDELNEIEKKLQRSLKRYPKSKIERKRFSIAVHYRNVADDQEKNVQDIVEGVAQGHKKLKIAHGKKVREIRPSLDWDKGKALLWILNLIKTDGGSVIFIGDDITDEDAFKVLKKEDISIIVRDEDRTTYAEYALESVEEVQNFLLEILEK